MGHYFKKFSFLLTLIALSGCQTLEGLNNDVGSVIDGSAFEAIELPEIDDDSDYSFGLFDLFDFDYSFGLFDLFDDADDAEDADEILPDQDVPEYIEDTPFEDAAIEAELEHLEATRKRAQSQPSKIITHEDYQRRAQARLAAAKKKKSTSVVKLNPYKPKKSMALIPKSYLDSEKNMSKKSTQTSQTAKNSPISAAVSPLTVTSKKCDQAAFAQENTISNIYRLYLKQDQSCTQINDPKTVKHFIHVFSTHYKDQDIRILNADKNS